MVSVLHEREKFPFTDAFRSCLEEFISRHIKFTFPKGSPYEELTSTCSAYPRRIRDIENSYRILQASKADPEICSTALPVIRQLSSANWELE